MSNTPPLPKDMPHIALIPGETDSDLSSSHRSFEGGVRSRTTPAAPHGKTEAVPPLDLIKTTIQNRPLTAVLTGLGIGIVLGLTARN